MAKYKSPTFPKLLEKLSYLTDEERAVVRCAYEVAEKQHHGQFRVSGEPYISHPVAVADILADLRADVETVAAGLLHDVVEDTEFTMQMIEQEFGVKVKYLVAGVTKLTANTGKELESSNEAHQGIADTSGQNGEQRPAPTRQGQWAENMRQLFLSSAEHPSILVIKLADRLHNMRTLYHIPNEDKRRRIARETLDIFAPVANRLGMWQMKWELEDLAFMTLQPIMYNRLRNSIAQKRASREQFVADVVQLIEQDIEEAGIEGEVSGRPKHIYSIWRKMQRKGIPFEEVYDVHGFRVIVDTIADCYVVLGLVHARWQPIPGEFDDYIARPKDNGYRSLHTAVFGPGGKHMEVQIRTREMHELAEQGVAAHWRYKESGQKFDPEFANKVAWLRALAQFEEDADDATEMVETIQADLFGDRVYVFTPKAEIVSLPAESTPIDFAYHIHTEIGHRCRGALVNGKMVRLDYQLKNRDQVEIITAKRGGPSRDWLNKNLNFVRTNRARSKIRSWFRKQDREQNIVAGRQSLDRMLKQFGLRATSYEDVAHALAYAELDDFLAAIGYGDISVERIAGALTLIKNQAMPPEEDKMPPQALGPTADQLSIVGTEGLLTRLAQCCKPLPGQPIIGYITRGRGITIHRADCPNVLNCTDPERLIQVDWGPSQPTYPVPIVVHAWDRAALLRDVTSVVAAERINISASNTKTEPQNRTADIYLTLHVSDAHQFARIVNRIEQVRNVISVERVV